jgi:hypothetical protein
MLSDHFHWINTGVSWIAKLSPREPREAVITILKVASLLQRALFFVTSAAACSRDLWSRSRLAVLARGRRERYQ